MNNNIIARYSPEGSAGSIFSDLTYTVLKLTKKNKNNSPTNGPSNETKILVFVSIILF